MHCKKAQHLVFAASIAFCLLETVCLPAYSQSSEANVETDANAENSDEFVYISGFGVPTSGALKKTDRDNPKYARYWCFAAGRDQSYLQKTKIQQRCEFSLAYWRFLLNNENAKRTTLRRERKEYNDATGAAIALYLPQKNYHSIIINPQPFCPVSYNARLDFARRWWSDYNSGLELSDAFLKASLLDSGELLYRTVRAEPNKKFRSYKAGYVGRSNPWPEEDFPFHSLLARNDDAHTEDYDHEMEQRLVLEEANNWHPFRSRQWHQGMR